MPIQTVLQTLHIDGTTEVTGLRIIAALIDFIPLIILLVVMAATLGDLGRSSIRLDGAPAFLYFVLVYAYYIGFEVTTGATIGKRIMGLRVVKVNGEAYGWGSCIGRNLFRLIDGLPVFYLVGVISVALTGRKQRLGDLAVGTLVVRE